MKRKVNLIRWLVLTSIIFTLALNLKAENFENVNLKMLDNQRIAIYVQNPQKQAMTIEITNSYTGELVYDAAISKNQFYAKLYNLSNLQEGSYTLKYQIENRVYEKELLLQGSKIELLTETEYNLPSFNQNNKNLLVTVPNPGKKDVNVSFWKDSESFFTDIPNARGSFTRNYNLKDLEPGEYDVKVTSGDQNYNYSFELE